MFLGVTQNNIHFVVFEVQWYLVITDFGYNGHGFVRYLLQFCPLHPNLWKNQKKMKKSAIFYVFCPKCRFFYNRQSALMDKVSPQVVRYNDVQYHCVSIFHFQVVCAGHFWIVSNETKATENLHMIHHEIQTAFRDKTATSIPSYQVQAGKVQLLPVFHPTIKSKQVRYSILPSPSR